MAVRRRVPDEVADDRARCHGGPNELRVADITYVPTWAGFLFPAVAQHQPSGVIHHCDRGTQYTSPAFGQRCPQAGVRPSMGSVGDAYEKAMCESFFASLECALLDRYTFKAHSEARLAVFRHIEGW